MRPVTPNVKFVGHPARAGVAGNDTLWGLGPFGASTAPTSSGHDGNDYLIGGAGRDHLLGMNVSDILDARDGGFDDGLDGKLVSNAADGFDIAYTDHGPSGADRVLRVNRVYSPVPARYPEPPQAGSRPSVAGLLPFGMPCPQRVNVRRAAPLRTRV